MARFKKDLGSRYFVVAKGENGSKPAYLEFRDASLADVSAHRAALARAQQGNQGTVLDDEHRIKTATVISAFVRARVVAAHGFEVEDESGQVRELTWEADADLILELIPEGLLDLFRRTIDSLNFPGSIAEFENASIAGSRVLPN